DQAFAAAAGDRHAGRSRSGAILLEPIDRRARRQRGDARPVAFDLRAEESGVLAGREPHDLQAIGMRVDNGERALTDRAGGSENGDSLHGYTTTQSSRSTQRT